MITLEELKAMPPHTVFATGTADNIYQEPIRWVAKRGFIHDWAIYYGNIDDSIDKITDWGTKLRTTSVIHRLVPSDDSMFAMYRY
jgi:hypothetical protein